MAVAWRSTCLILLLVANFQLATVVQAQTDHSFSRWLDARERLAKGLAAETGISVEAAIAQIRAESVRALYDNKYVIFLINSGGPAEQRQADLKQFENDKAEATERGTTAEVVLAERLAEQIERLSEQIVRARLAREEAARIKAEAKKRQVSQLAVAATIVIVVVVIVFRARRRIAVSSSRKWRGKSEAFRAWAFGSFSWAVGTFLYVWLAEPYGSSMRFEEVWHMFGVMIVSPLFLGAVWFGYKRFVK